MFKGVKKKVEEKRLEGKSCDLTDEWGGSWPKPRTPLQGRPDWSIGCECQAKQVNWGNGMDEEGGQGYSLGQTLKANMERSLSMEWGGGGNTEILVSGYRNRRYWWKPKVLLNPRQSQSSV